MALARGGDGSCRLRRMHHAFNPHEAGAERITGPGEQRVPGLRPALSISPAGRVGAVTDEIGAEILFDLGRYRPRSRRRPRRSPHWRGG